MHVTYQLKDDKLQIILVSEICIEHMSCCSNNSSKMQCSIEYGGNYLGFRGHGVPEYIAMNELS